MVCRKYMTVCREWGYAIGQLVTYGLKEMHDRLQGNEGIWLGDCSLMVWKKYVTGCRGVKVYHWVTGHWCFEESTCPMTQEDLHVQQQHCESIKSWLVWITCEFLLFWSIQLHTFSNITCCVIEEPHLMLYIWCFLNLNSLSIYQHIVSTNVHLCVLIYLLHVSVVNSYLKTVHCIIHKSLHFTMSIL